MRSYIFIFPILLSLAILNCRISYVFQTIALPKPDKHIRTGMYTGYEVFLWKCADGKRIVVYRWEPEMPFVDFDPYHKDQNSCDQITEFEKQNGNSPIEEWTKR